MLGPYEVEIKVIFDKPHAWMLTAAPSMRVHMSFISHLLPTPPVQAHILFLSLISFLTCSCLSLDMLPTLGLVVFGQYYTSRPPLSVDLVAAKAEGEKPRSPMVSHHGALVKAKLL